MLETVEARAREMAEELSRVLPYPLVYKVTAKTNKEITDVLKEANYRDECAGIVTCCHTFSPGKMWVNGLAALQRTETPPLLVHGRSFRYNMVRRWSE